MLTICPKCRSVRPAQTSVPSWQCPACGVAYAKAGDTGVSTRRSAVTAGRSGDGGSWLSSIPWLKLVLVVAVAYGAWVGLHRTPGNAPGTVPASLAGKFGANPSIEQLTALASSTPSADVLMYSAPWCSYCAAAKGWLAQYGFKYQECDIQASRDCLSQLKALDPQGGVPHHVIELIVKGRHMKDGFDSDEFIAALRQ